MKERILQFPEDVVVSIIADFAENYTFEEKNEVQTMHWYSNCNVPKFWNIRNFCILE